jgi:hypothetical protein
VRETKTISAFRIRFIQRFWFASLIAVFITLAAKSAYACTPFPPTPWFNENVSLAGTNRPSGILIKQDGHIVSLINNLDTSSFYIDIYNELKEFGKSVNFSSDNNILFANGYAITGLEHRNILQDNRPVDVKLPEPQDTVIQIMLDQKFYSFQLKISYSLNNKYISDSVYGFDNACRGFDLFYGLFGWGFYFPGPIYLIAGLILIILIPAIVIIVKENNTPDK